VIRRAALAIVVAGCAALAPDGKPMAPGGRGRVVVEAEVNGADCLFIVDSGASITSVTPQAAERLGITPAAWTAVNDRRTPTGKLAKLSLGAVQHRDVRVAIVEVPAARLLGIRHDGILGLDVLSRHDVVFDFADRRVELFPSGRVARSHSARDMERLRFFPSRHGLVILTANLDAQPVRAILDLGTGVSAANAATPRRPMHVQLGNLDLGEHDLPVENHSMFRRSGLERDPAIVLGLDMFHGRTLAIAYQERAIYVSR
jgi:hypothetical protein